MEKDLEEVGLGQYQEMMEVISMVKKGQYVDNEKMMSLARLFRYVRGLWINACRETSTTYSVCILGIIRVMLKMISLSY